MAEKKEIKEVVVKDTYLPAIPDPAVLEQLKKDNLEGTVISFEVIRIPTGGQLAWAIPTETGDDRYEKEVAGAVLDHYPTRLYWEGEYAGGGQPPDCSSSNGITGNINPNTNFDGPVPTGRCGKKKCPLAEYDQKLGRTPCKEIRRVYVLTSESILPFLISLPPTSGASERSPWTSYVAKLFGRGRSTKNVITKFTLFEDKSKGVIGPDGVKHGDGIKYSRVLPFMVREMTDEEKTKTQTMTELFKDPMRQRPLSPEDEYNTNGGSEGTSATPAAQTEPWDEKKDKDDIPF